MASCKVRVNRTSPCGVAKYDLKFCKSVCGIRHVSAYSLHLIPAYYFFATCKHLSEKCWAKAAWQPKQKDKDDYMLLFHCLTRMS